jgi:hypothetical protein
MPQALFSPHAGASVTFDPANAQGIAQILIFAKNLLESVRRTIGLSIIQPSG